MQRIFITCLTGFLCLLVSFSVTAQPRNLRISWTGAQNVQTYSTMAVTWESNDAKDYFIRFGADSLNLSKFLKAEKSSVGSRFVFKIVLNGLIPSTKYFYQCGDGMQQWSSIYHFKTGPKNGNREAFTIGVIGDTQNNNGNLDFEKTREIVNRLKPYRLDFMMHMGDMVENGSVGPSWEKFFDVLSPLTATTPFLPIAGNHDVINNSQSVNFQKPYPIFGKLFNLPGDGLNYAYQYGNIYVIAINSGYAQGAAKLGKVYFAENSPESDWLAAEISGAKKRKGVDWVILNVHYPVYSFGVSGVPLWQEHMRSLLKKYPVDLCLSGHRHVYERHTEIKGGKPLEINDKHRYQKREGTIFITNGSAGGSLQGIGGQSLKSMIFTPEENTYNYAIMYVNGKELRYEVMDNTGRIVDHFSISK